MVSGIMFHLCVALLTRTQLFSEWDILSNLVKHAAKRINIVAWLCQTRIHCFRKSITREAFWIYRKYIKFHKMYQVTTSNTFKLGFVKFYLLECLLEALVQGEVDNFKTRAGTFQKFDGAPLCHCILPNQCQGLFFVLISPQFLSEGAS